MRTSLIPGLLKNVTHNSRQSGALGGAQNSGANSGQCRIFECGYAHFMENSEAYAQEARLGLAIWGTSVDLWNKAETLPVFELKTAVENLLRQLGVAKWKWLTPKPEEIPEFLHPGQAAWLQAEGKSLGFIGSLHPYLLEQFKIRQPVALAELNLDKLLMGQPRHPRFKSISKHPAVDRDLAFVIPKNLPIADIENVIRQSAGNLLQSVSVFDVFSGGQLAEHERSVAFRLVFQDLETTLEDARVNELRDKVINAVTQKFSIALR